MLAVACLQCGDGRLRRAHQQPEVGRDGDEVESRRAVLRHLLGRAAHRAHRHAQRLAALRGLRHQIHHGGVGELTDMAHRTGQVGRTEEDGVDPGHRSNRFELGHRVGCFELHDHADALVGGLEVIRDGAEARAAAHARHAAHAFGRVARGGHGAACFVGVLHEREQHGRGTGIEHALDGHRVVPRDPHDGQHLGAGHRLQQVDDLHHVQRRVLHVDHTPVETGAAHRLGHDGAG